MAKIIVLQDHREKKEQKKQKVSCGTGERDGWGHQGPLALLPGFYGQCFTCGATLNPEEFRATLIVERAVIDGMIGDIDASGVLP